MFKTEAASTFKTEPVRLRRTDPAYRMRFELSSSSTSSTVRQKGPCVSALTLYAIPPVKVLIARLHQTVATDNNTSSRIGSKREISYPGCRWLNDRVSAWQYRPGRAGAGCPCTRTRLMAGTGSRQIVCSEGIIAEAWRHRIRDTKCVYSVCG